MEAIPTSPLRRGTTLFSILPAALGIQELVRFRCLASPTAISTPLSALDRLILTQRIQIRPLALQRFCLTPSAQKTQLSGLARLNLTKSEIATPQSALLRFLMAQRFAATPQLVTGPSFTIRPATKTQQSVLLRSVVV